MNEEMRERVFNVLCNLATEIEVHEDYINHDIIDAMRAAAYLIEELTGVEYNVED